MWESDCAVTEIYLCFCCPLIPLGLVTCAELCVNLFVCLSFCSFVCLFVCCLFVCRSGHEVISRVFGTFISWLHATIKTMNQTRVAWTREAFREGPLPCQRRQALSRAYSHSRRFTVATVVHFLVDFISRATCQSREVWNGQGNQHVLVNNDGLRRQVRVTGNVGDKCQHTLDGSNCFRSVLPPSCHSRSQHHQVVVLNLLYLLISGLTCSWSCGVYRIGVDCNDNFWIEMPW